METRLQRHFKAAADEQVHNVLIKPEVESLTEDSHAPDLAKQELEVVMESIPFIKTEEDPYHTDAQANAVQEFTAAPQTDDYIKAELILDEEFRDQMSESEKKCKQHVLALAEDQQAKVSISDKKVGGASFAKNENVNIHMHWKHSNTSGPQIADDNSIDSHMEEFLDEETNFFGQESAQASVSKSGTKSEACEICHCIYRTEYMRTHMRLEHSEPKYRCEFCSRLFKKKHHLERHLNTHAADRKREFVCDICERAFYEKTHLVAHMKVFAEKDHPKFNCEVCPSSFTGKGDLDVHMLTKHLEKSQPITPAPNRKRDFACDICERAFYTKSHLNDHKKRYAQKEHPKFNCEECSSSFTRKGDVDVHMLSKHLEISQPIIPAPQTPEELCERMFSKKISLRRHQEVHAKKGRTKFKVSTFTCEVCGASFAQKRNLKNHMVRHHLGKAQSNTSAPQTAANGSTNTHAEEFLDEESSCYGQACQESVAKDSGSKSDVKGEACEVCQCIYPIEYIRTHMRLAHPSNQPKYQCEFCSRTLKTKFALLKHLSTHATERKRDFVCDICERAYYEKGKLDAHKKRFAEKDHPKFNCAVCLSFFTKKGNLDEHMLTKHLVKSPPINPALQTADEESTKAHQILKNKQCEVCFQSFKTKTILKRHLITHSKDRKRDFPCDLCGMTFFRKCNLLGHKKNVHSRNTYACKVCGKRFTQKRSLKRHMLRSQHFDESQQCTPQPSHVAGVPMKTELLSDEEFIDEKKDIDSVSHAEGNQKPALPANDESCQG